MMNHTLLNVAHTEDPFSLDGFGFPDIIAPCVHKGKLAQTHYFFPAARASAIAMQVFLRGAEASSKCDWEEAGRQCAADQGRYPYGQTESQWWEYCLAPHSYLPLHDGKIQVGLNFFNRFLHIDFHARSAELVDPGAGNEMLSTTNWFDHQTGDIWFASWPVSETVRRVINRRNPVRVTLWKYSDRKKQAVPFWQGDLGDSLHQLSVSPDRRFLILTELGLWPEESIPEVGPDQCPSAWRRVMKKGLVPSKILVLNLETKEEWRLPMPTAAHVEFDPQDHDICYLSGHNIGLIGARVGIFGNGMIRKIRLKKTGPEPAGEFSHPRFHRITTHIVFRHRGKVLIGVSGYPGTLFFIDAAAMKLYKTIEMDAGEIVETSRYPHICCRDGYGIAPSADGEALLVAGTGFVRAVLVDHGRFVSEKIIDSYGADACFTGHLGVKEYPLKGMNA